MEFLCLQQPNQFQRNYKICTNKHLLKITCYFLIKKGEKVEFFMKVYKNAQMEVNFFNFPTLVRILHLFLHQFHP